MTCTNAGRPTSRLIEVTNFAIELAFGMRLNKKRSKARPKPGARTTTDSTKASQTGKWADCTRAVMTRTEM